MIRAFVLLLLMAAHATADEYRGTFKKVDTQARTLEVRLREGVKTLPLEDKVKVLGLNQLPLKDGLDSKLLSRPGVVVLVKTETRQGWEVVLEIQVLRRSSAR